MNHIFSEIVPIVAILATFGIPAAVIIVISVLRYRQKMMLITRGCFQPMDFPGSFSQGPLLWGMVLSSMSAAGLIISAIQKDADFATLDILLLTIGLALLAYWFITAPQRNRERELCERKYGVNGVICPVLNTRAPLLWGMVLTAVSAAGIVISLVRYEYDWANMAVLPLSAGVVLLAYWFVTAPQRKRAMTIFEEKCGAAR